ncbi:hypothetical protein HYU16_00215 [Candidatus Woesearchaeota archaeon]|nr:hypothetical protein [Candidatus Woesearchaeota archaeon]
MAKKRVSVKSVEITVYKITGKQLFFNVKKEFCRECDLCVAVAKEAAASVLRKYRLIKVSVVVKPWLNNLFEAMLRGVWHPPGIVVGNKLISQGIVPDKKGIEKAVLVAAEKG